MIGYGAAVPNQIQYHLDESVTSLIADALRRRGIDVTTTVEARLLSASDDEQLAYALRAGRVLVTRDHDFLAISRRNARHAGIVYWPPQRRDLGEAINLLTLLWRLETPESIAGRVEFL